MSGMPFDVEAHIDLLKKEAERKEQALQKEREIVNCFKNFNEVIDRAEIAFMARKWTCPQFKKDMVEIAQILKERPVLRMRINRLVLTDLGF